MAHVSMRSEEAVRDADPVVVTTSSNVRGGRGKIDGLLETKASSLPPPPPPPSPHLATPSQRRTIWKVNKRGRGRVSQPVDKEIGRLVLFKARNPPTRPVFQRNQVVSLNSNITHPIYASCLDDLRNEIFHTSNTNNLV